MEFSTQRHSRKKNNTFGKYVDNNVKNTNYSTIKKSQKLCKTCEISLNFDGNKLPECFDVMTVSNTSNNSILVKIMENKHRFNCGESFIILVDGSKYTIEILSNDGNKVELKQIVSHYNGGKGTQNNLMNSYVRFVRITIN